MNHLYTYAIKACISLYFFVFTSDTYFSHSIENTVKKTLIQQLKSHTNSYSKFKEKISDKASLFLSLTKLNDKQNYNFKLLFENGQFFIENKTINSDKVYDYLMKKSSFATIYYFQSTKNSGISITQTNKENTRENNTFYFNNKKYIANSYMTLLGRDDRNNNVGDFSEIKKLSKKDIQQILDHGKHIIHNIYKGKVERAMFKESIGGYLDYKDTAYEILHLNKSTLLEIDGIVYNPNEAGNFLWAMVLEYNHVLISPITIAKYGTLIAAKRQDETWEQKAIEKGRNYAFNLLKRNEPNKVEKFSFRLANLK